MIIFGHDSNIVQDWKSERKRLHSGRFFIWINIDYSVRISYNYIRGDLHGKPES